MKRLPATARAILAGRHADPFSYLGQHREQDKTVVRVFLPNANRVAAIEESGTERELSRLDNAGLFAGTITDIQHYRLRAKFGETDVELEDAYRFPPKPHPWNCVQCLQEVTQKTVQRRAKITHTRRWFVENIIIAVA